MLFRSLRTLATRTLAAGAASALALNLFNAAQPSLGGSHKLSPGTLKDVQFTLGPVAAGPANAATLVTSGPGQAASSATAPRAAAPSAAARPAVESAPVKVGKARFVGFSWPEQAAVGTVWLRARTSGGWAGWRKVEQAADGPDATSREYRPGRAYSDGQWLDAGTTEVQVRVDPPAAKGGAGAGARAQAVPSNGVEAHLITPDMAPTPGTEPARAGVATAATAQPRIISRAGWGADERIRRNSPEYSDTVKAAFVHHTVQSNSYSPSESAALIRADYLYHVRSRGWNDIGDNFLVDRYGRVFEGRYGGITRAVLGAHAGGFNTDSTGVALLGTFTTARPTGPMLAGLERLLAWKLDLTHVDPTGLTVLTSAGGANVRYPAGRRVVVRTILGHGSTSYTTCPGSPTLRLLSSIRSATSRIGRPKIYGGSATTSRVRPEHGGYAGVHARFSSTVRWRVAVTGSNGATVRSFTGTGSEAKVRWNGRTTGGALAPPGWATMTVTAAAGGATARPVVSRVFVDRTPPPAGSSTGGFAAGAWRVNNANAEQLSTSAAVFASYRWGRSGDLPVVGDWDGDGTQTVGVVRPNAALDRNHLLRRNSDGSLLDFWYGRHGDRILVGDWNGDGTWTPAAVRNGAWSLRNSNSTGGADATVSFGRAGDRYLAGDWDGDGDFTPGVHRAGTVWLRNSAGSGPSDVHLRFGRPSDHGYVGDWNGNGTWTPGVLRAGTRWYLKDSFTGSAAGVGLTKQTPGTPVVGDWDNRP
ncbi:MAG: peptidoglycan recognition protein [Actinomycetes bacterium]